MRLTRAGFVIVGLLLLSVVLTLFAHGTIQAIALVVGAVILLLCAAEGAARGSGGVLAQDARMANGDFSRKREVYERDAEMHRQTHPRD